VCGNKKLTQAAHYTSLDVPVKLTAWFIGLVLLKICIANLPALFRMALAALNSVGSFVFGTAPAEILGNVLRVTVISALVWIGFRRILGWDTNLVKGIERLATGAAMISGRFALQVFRGILAWITAFSPEKPRGRRK
jgi:hypothetical protein